MSSFVYGLVFHNKFISQRMNLDLKKHFSENVDNGIYQMDMEEDDFAKTLELADIDNAIAYFKKHSKFQVIRGISFKSGFIPQNPVKYKGIPIFVNDANFDDFEEIDVLYINGIYYFLQNVYTNNAYPLLEAKDICQEMIEKDSVDVCIDVKDSTPEIRLAIMLNKMEVSHEINKRKIKESKNIETYAKEIFEHCGANVISVKKKNYGIEIVWEYEGNSINSLVSEDLNVIEAGFCMSGYDRTQSAHSVVNVMKEYIEGGDYIYKTRY